MPPKLKVKKGWLTKRGYIRKNWKKRWFVLDPTKGGAINYFKTQDTTKMSGSIAIKDCISVKTADDITHKENSFLVQVGDRTYFFIADTHEDKTDWINIIGKAIIMKSQLTMDEDYEEFGDRDAGGAEAKQAVAEPVEAETAESSAHSALASFDDL